MLKNNTKNINLYLLNNKFNQSILNLNMDGASIHGIPSDQSIYKYLFSKYKDMLNKDTIFILNTSIVSQEILQFINDLNSTITTLLYVDNSDNLSDLLSFLAPNLKLIIHNTLDSTTINNPKIVLPQFILDKKLYSHNQKTKKINQIVYFLDKSANIINEKLTTLLYPATKLPIKLFNNENIKHHQNLGYLNELDKRRLLYESTHYLHDNDYYYVPEALTAGCLCLNLDDQSSIENQIQNYNSTIYDNIKINMKDYNDIVQEICYA